MVTVWKVLKQEAHQLPSGFSISLKLAESTVMSAENVPTTTHSMSISSGRFFFPMRVEDVSRVAELLQEWAKERME